MKKLFLTALSATMLVSCYTQSELDEHKETYEILAQQADSRADAAIAAANATIDELSAALEVAEQNVFQLEAAVVEATAEIAALNAQNIEKGAEIDLLNGIIDDANSRIADLEADLAALEAEIADLLANPIVITETVIQYIDRVVTVIETVEVEVERVVQVGGDTTALEAEIARLNAIIETLQIAAGIEDETSEEEVETTLTDQEIAESLSDVAALDSYNDEGSACDFHTFLTSNIILLEAKIAAGGDAGLVAATQVLLDEYNGVFDAAYGPVTITFNEASPEDAVDGNGDAFAGPAGAVDLNDDNDMLDDVQLTLEWDATDCEYQPNGDAAVVITDNADTPDTGTDSDTTETADADADGTPDSEDAFPNDASEDTDADGDGVGANADYDDNDASIQNAPVVNGPDTYSYSAWENSGEVIVGTEGAGVPGEWSAYTSNGDGTESRTRTVVYTTTGNTQLQTRTATLNIVDAADVPAPVAEATEQTIAAADTTRSEIETESQNEAPAAATGDVTINFVATGSLASFHSGSVSVNGATPQALSANALTIAVTEGDILTFTYGLQGGTSEDVTITAEDLADSAVTIDINSNAGILIKS